MGKAKVKYLSIIMFTLLILLLIQPQKILAADAVGITYRGHVQSIGWQSWVADGAEAGTHGKSLRVEAMNLKLVNAPTGASIKYQGHVQNIGWQSVVADGAEVGTDGKGLRVEAIKLVLVNLPGYSVQYRAHVQKIGWQPWVSDGVESGTDGKGLRIEAIEVRLVKTIDGSTPKPIDFLPATPIPTTTLTYTWDTVRNTMLNAKIGLNFTEENGITEGKKWSILQYDSNPEYTTMVTEYTVFTMASEKDDIPNIDIGIGWMGTNNKDTKILANLNFAWDIMCRAISPNHEEEFSNLINAAKLRHVEKGNMQDDLPTVCFLNGRRIYIRPYSMGFMSIYISAINDKSDIWTELNNIDKDIQQIHLTKADLKKYMPELKNY